MTNANIREAHKLLDSLFDNSELSHAQIDLIRGLMPELPKQKTLAEITSDVYRAWYDTIGSDWDKESYGDLDAWLHELHAHLIEIEDTPAAALILPAGMRIAEHEDYGRVVAAPIADSDGERMIFCLDKTSLTGAGRCWAHEDSLTFIAAEPDKSAHPEFLETEGDYKDAPDGTTVARGSSSPWVKQGTVWENVAFGGKFSKDLASVPRRVLRWGNE